MKSCLYGCVFLLVTHAEFAYARLFTADLNTRSNRANRFSREVQNTVLTPLRFHVASKIYARFASTLVTSVTENRSPQNKEAVFLVYLPQAAFISNFSMVVDDKLYLGQVREKIAAREEYEKAKNKNFSTGLVSYLSDKPAVRGMDKFQISLNVAPNSTAEFRLNYQQLLQRRKGFYEQVISVRPKHIVPVLNISVDVQEPQDIKFVDVMKIRKDPSDSLVKGNPLAVTRHTSPKSVCIEYSPSEDEQEKQGIQGIDGDFLVRYDVYHGNEGNLIQVHGSYFVQFFSPSGLSSLPKNVVFVIDVSGSMSGEKIAQTRQAMHAILNQLRPGDMFNIVLFSGIAFAWKDEVSPVDAGRIQAAKTFVNERVNASGSTNINDALLMALNLLKNSINPRNSEIAGKLPVVLFLTDGEPTRGETDTRKIRRNIVAANGIKAPIFALGFGFDLNFDFLTALSVENAGTAHRIYQGKDAASQLEGFFDEISTPLLLRIRFEYPKALVNENDTTALAFSQYYNGSELVVGGKLKAGDSSRMMSMNIRGYDGKNNVVYSPASRTLQELTIPSSNLLIEDLTERLWAYMKIKELLLQIVVSADVQEQARLKSEALQLSLKYNFVTPLTSFVVVQSDVYLRSTFASDSVERMSEDHAALASAGREKLSVELLFLLILFFFVCAA